MEPTGSDPSVPFAFMKIRRQITIELDGLGQHVSPMATAILAKLDLPDSTRELRCRLVQRTDFLDADNDVIDPALIVQAAKSFRGL